MENKKSRSKYITNFIKENYVRKEIKFRTEEWEKIVEPGLKKKKTTLKKIVLDYLKK